MRISRPRREDRAAPGSRTASRELYGELEARGLDFRPHVVALDEWFSPDGVPGFAIPFYLAHPRLMRLERQHAARGRGRHARECMQILRHECGHAIQHAYQLHRRAALARALRPLVEALPGVLPAEPGEPPLRAAPALWYAQSHPTRTSPRPSPCGSSRARIWRRRYARLAGAAKARVRGRADGARSRTRGPPSRRRARPTRSHRIAKTLREHYAEKRAQLRAGLPGHLRPRPAAALLRRPAPPDARERGVGASCAATAREIRGMVARWTGEYQFTLDQVLGDMIGRCRELALRAVGSERQLLLDFARAADGADRCTSSTVQGTAGLDRRSEEAPRPRADAPGLRAARRSVDGATPAEVDWWKTEYDVLTALRALGHEVHGARRAVRRHADPRGGRGVRAAPGLQPARGVPRPGDASTTAW